MSQICRALTVLGLVAGLAACGETGTSDAPRSSAPTVAAPPSPEAPPALAECLPDDAESVRFTPDGDQYGAVLGSGEVGVVLLNEVGDNLCGWLPYASELARGRQVLLFERRGAGTRADKAVAGARLLADRGATSVFLMGASAGADAALLAGASLEPSPAGIVGLSPPGGGNVIGAAESIDAPVLLITAEGDSAPLPERVEAVADAVPGSRADALVVSGREHGVQLVHGSHADQVGTRIDDFLTSNS